MYDLKSTRSNRRLAKWDAQENIDRNVICFVIISIVIVELNLESSEWSISCVDDHINRKDIRSRK